MDSETSKEMAGKEQLQQLRKARQATIAAAAARLKVQKQTAAAIREQLQQPRTVPEVAEATGIAPQTVLWYVAALKKYGQVKELDKAGSHFRYVAGTGS